MIAPKSMPILIGEVVDRVRSVLLPIFQADATMPNMANGTINYEYGNIREVLKELNLKTANPTAKGKRYPLIVLLEDIPIDKTKTAYFGIVTCQIIIAVDTSAQWTSAEREVNSFAKVLRPIYEEICTQLARQPEFVIYNREAINHKAIERKYWGQDSNTKDYFGEYIDAIQMQDVTFALNYKYCS